VLVCRLFHAFGHGAPFGKPGIVVAFTAAQALPDLIDYRFLLMRRPPSLHFAAKHKAARPLVVARKVLKTMM
jgi:hypothetical protein